ncbi:hypothetical protein D9758_010340 [Tetrapyrgos nigripes]|uniref:Uncharacterized protein n=1 Tax=Tetrapyrgos nigripes TaxID=182062 RepID=A0A8H5D0G6_9AGAR|nr:hypothetical protein D9758_010340 [Tetrapyrgos nigripes]
MTKLHSVPLTFRPPSAMTDDSASDSNSLLPQPPTSRINEPPGFDFPSSLDTAGWTSYIASAQEFQISDTRSTSDPLQYSVQFPTTEPGPPESYLCHNDDTNFLRDFEEGGDKYRSSRLEWLWLCATRVISGLRTDLRLALWRSLVMSRDIWALWRDGDDAALPRPQDCAHLQDRWESPSYTDWKEIAGVMKAERPRPVLFVDLLDLPDGDGYCVDAYRLPMVLWLAMMTCYRKLESTTTSIGSLTFESDFLMPDAVLEWWSMIPLPIKDRCVGFFDSELNPSLSDEMRKWTVWINVHHFLEEAPPPPLLNSLFGPQESSEEFPSRNIACRLSNSTRKIFSSITHKPVKPHVVALWCIQRVVQRCGFPDYGASLSPHDHWKTSVVSNMLKGDAIDLGDNLSPSVLARLDKWLMALPGKGFASDLPVALDTEIRRLIPDSDWIPAAWLPFLAEPRWRETEDAISSVASAPFASTSLSSQSEDAVDGVSWLCAMILFSIARYIGFGPDTARAFARIIEYDFAPVFEKLPTPPMTSTSKGFREALNTSLHTCFKPATAHYYACAYSLLLGVPVVGCNQNFGYLGLPWSGESSRHCSVCVNADAFHRLSRFVDKNSDILAADSGQNSVENPISLARKLIDELNYPTRKELRALNGTLKIISDALSSALDNTEGDDDETIDFDNPDQDSADSLSWYTETEACADSDLDNDETIGKADHSDSSELATGPSSRVVEGGPVSEIENTIRLTEVSVAEMSNVALLTELTQDLIALPDSPSPALSPVELQEPSHSVNPGSEHSSEFITRPLEDPPGNDINSRSFSFVHHNYAHKSKTKPRKTEMVDEIKQRLKSLLEHHGVVVEYVNGEPKLPWKSLPRILQNHNLQFINWPPGVAQPHTRNGIEKVPLKDIVKLYDAINKREGALDICPIMDASGQREINVVLENPSSSRSGQKKRALLSPPDENESEGSRVKRRRMAVGSHE